MSDLGIGKSEWFPAFWEFYGQAETTYLLAIGLSFMAVAGAAGYFWYINSQGYIIRKIMRDTLSTPAVLNELIQDDAWRQSHEFIACLNQEIDYLDKFFVYHDELTQEDIHHYTKRTMEDAEFFHESYEDDQQKKLIHNIEMLIRFKRSAS